MLFCPAGAAATAAVQAAANEQAVAINNIDVSSEYIMKLRQELEGHAERLFTATSEQDRLRRCVLCRAAAVCALSVPTWSACKLSVCLSVVVSTGLVLAQEGCRDGRALQPCVATVCAVTLDCLRA